MIFSSDPASQTRVVAEANATKGQLDGIKTKYHQAVVSLTGVKSPATTALKGVIDTEVTPRFEKILGDFQRLFDAINSATTATVNANASGSDSVQRFRGVLGGVR